MEYTLEDVFMAGLGESFEKTAGAEEIDISQMPVFAKLAANLGLVEEPPAEEGTSMLEKLALFRAKKGPPPSRAAAAKERLKALIARAKKSGGAAVTKGKEWAKKHPKAMKGITHGAAGAGGLGLGGLLGRASKRGKDEE